VFKLFEFENQGITIW